MLLSPDQYPQASPHDLLQEAERGRAGLDQRWLKALLDRPEEFIPALLEFARDYRPGDREDLRADLLAIFRHLHDPRSLPFLVDLARQTEDLTLELIDTFRSIGAPSVDALLPLYEETKGDPHCEIAFLLASLGMRDQRILQVLTARLEIDPIDAGHCLAAYRDPAGLPALERMVAGTTDPLLRGPLEQALERLKKGEPDVAEDPFDIWAHFPAESDPHFEWMEKDEYRAFLESSVGKYRAAALACMDDDGLGKRDHDPIFRMAREDPDPLVRGRAWQALSDAWDRSDIREAMRARIADAATPVEERCGVLVALAAREGDRPDIQKWIVEFYERPESRAAALRSMSLCGDPRFEKYFPRHLGDEDVQVQLQAIQGVGLLEISSAVPALAALFEDEDLRQDALMAYTLAADTPLTRRGIRQLIEKIDKIAGLSEEEESTVKIAINYRLERNDLPPLFDEGGDWVEEEIVKAPVKAGRNDPCPCGSGKKYKKCCGA